MRTAFEKHTVQIKESACTLSLWGDPEVLDYLGEKLKARPEGYFYAPSYDQWRATGGKSGWDGFVRHLKRLGYSQATAMRGRRNEILKWCAEKGYQMDVTGLLPQLFPNLMLEDIPAKLINAPFELDHYQRQSIQNWLTNGIGINQMSVGSGKCLGKGTPVMMANGRCKPVENIVVGDRLMGPDSLPRRVRTLGRGHAPLYKVVQRNGDSYVCNGDHILAVQVFEHHGLWPRTRYSTETKTITVDNYLKLSRHKKPNYRGYKVGIELPEQPVPLDPYFVGLWLGDGSVGRPAITTADPEIVDFIFKFAAFHGLEIRTERQKSKCSILHLRIPPWPRTCACGKPHYCGGFCQKCFNALRRSGRRPKGRGHPVKQALRALGILNSKALPDAYKFNSRKVRLGVLAGLVDSDGFSGGRFIEITQVSKNLADDICWLARSLGYTASVSPKRTTCQTGVVGQAWRVYISGRLSELPVRIARKRTNDCIGSERRTAITVEPVGMGDFYGFELDGDGLFLLGDFTVTHNTATFSGAAAMIKRRFPEGTRILYMTPSERLVRQGVKDMRQFLPDWDIGQFGGGRKEKHAKDMIVATVAMLWKNRKILQGEGWFRSFQVLLYDESHHVTSPSSQALLQLIPAFFRLGASDSIHINDEEKMAVMKDYLGDILSYVPAQVHIATNRLAKPHIYVENLRAFHGRYNQLSFQAPIGSKATCLLDHQWVNGIYQGPVTLKDAKGEVRMQSRKVYDREKGVWEKIVEPMVTPGRQLIEIEGELFEVDSRWCLLERVYDHAIVRFRERNQLITKWAKHFSGRGLPTLVVCTRTLHIYALEAAISQALGGQEKVGICFGWSSSKIRDDMFDWVRSTPGAVLITPLAKEGVSIHELRAGIVADYVGDTETANQIVGRIMRQKSSDNYAEIVWFLDAQHRALRAGSRTVIEAFSAQYQYPVYDPAPPVD